MFQVGEWTRSSLVHCGMVFTWNRAYHIGTSAQSEAEQWTTLYTPISVWCPSLSASQRRATSCTAEASAAATLDTSTTFDAILLHASDSTNTLASNNFCYPLFPHSLYLTFDFISLNRCSPLFFKLPFLFLELLPHNSPLFIPHWKTIFLIGAKIERKEI